MPDVKKTTRDRLRREFLALSQQYYCLRCKYPLWLQPSSKSSHYCSECEPEPIETCSECDAVVSAVDIFRCRACGLLVCPLCWDEHAIAHQEEDEYVGK